MSKLHEIKKKNGVVYTPSNLANYVAEKVMGYFFDSFSTQAKQINQVDGVDNLNLQFKIIDPACGDGELLISVWKAFSKKLIENREQFSSGGLDPSHILCGLDIDAKAIKKTKNRISSLSNSFQNNGHFNLIKTNALFPYNRKQCKKAWKVIYDCFNANDGFDILIANPPWGADTKAYESRLSNGNYSLYKGQFDTSDLFIELALTIVKPGGYFAFIIPDSIFNIERLALRKMLLNEVEIKYIGRFGEKIFENINRACVVLICRNMNVSGSANVDCLRLTPQFRKNILRGELTFKSTEKFLLHKVPQRRFLNNRDFLFDIDTREDERQTLEIFKSSQTTFRDYLKSSRGIELSKTGKACQCNHCNLWLPYPISHNPKCTHCKKQLILSEMQPRYIVNDKPTKGYELLLVGESINRYSINSNFWIATNKTGIAYKDKSLYEGPKIVIRKTGVGLLAAIDYHNSYTNQVVYIFKTKQDINQIFPLELFLAFMNSRAIYYYLVKSYGETEWRSHPYLTQNQILALPLPKIDLYRESGLKMSRQIIQYLTTDLNNGNGISPRIDAKVEYLVSCLYGLSKNDYERIYKTLEEVENLVPIKPLKNISISDIFGC